MCTGLLRGDMLVLESTYGDREHDPAPLEVQLLSTIRRTLESHGIVLIPSFAGARAQLKALLIGRLMSMVAFLPCLSMWIVQWRST